MDMKNGDGKFFYLDKGHIYTGWWLNNVPKCGTFEDFVDVDSSNPISYQFPKCDLIYPENVVSDAKLLLLNL